TTLPTSLIRSSTNHRDPHAFPTRRSSDLENGTRALHHYDSEMNPLTDAGLASLKANEPYIDEERHVSITPVLETWRSSSMYGSRSEEHTSELQSRFDLVCRLLPEKKNK